MHSAGKFWALWPVFNHQIKNPLFITSPKIPSSPCRFIKAEQDSMHVSRYNSFGTNFPTFGTNTSVSCTIIVQSTFRSACFINIVSVLSRHKCYVGNRVKKYTNSAASMFGLKANVKGI